MVLIELPEVKTRNLWLDFVAEKSNKAGKWEGKKGLLRSPSIPTWRPCCKRSVAEESISIWSSCFCKIRTIPCRFGSVSSVWRHINLYKLLNAEFSYNRKVDRILLRMNQKSRDRIGFHDRVKIGSQVYGKQLSAFVVTLPNTAAVCIFLTWQQWKQFNPVNWIMGWVQNSKISKYHDWRSENTTAKMLQVTTKMNMLSFSKE